jgi:hypothetical protein
LPLARDRKNIKKGLVSHRMRCQLAAPVCSISTMTKAEKGTDKRKQIRGRLQTALNLMIFGGDNRVALPWNEAAKSAHFSVQAMRKAIAKPHVQQYLRAQRQVLIAAISGQNPARLAQLRDQDENRGAAVRAAQAIEQIGAAEQARPSNFAMPGFCVQIINVPQQSASQVHAFVPPAIEAPRVVEVVAPCAATVSPELYATDRGMTDAERQHAALQRFIRAP